ncbi:MAG: 2'-5' RNA ligase family protein [Pyrinomonadaceae bacterium]|nr:2'-5' RNA ligase family protein [Pyrinomonadaceae bacterium]
MVEKLWAAIEKEFGIRGVYRTPFPHISYHVSGHYNVDKIKTVMDVFARHTSPFRVRCCGLGVFTGPEPVVYIPVVRSPQLADFQHELWHQVTKSADDLDFAYRPARWVPHITLARHDLTQRAVAAIVRKFCTMELNQTVTVNNLALIYDTGGKEEVIYRVQLNEGGGAGPKRYRPWAESRYER